MQHDTGSLIHRTSTCTICAGQHYPCATGRTWPSYTGPCIACGRETRTSALCGHPHCTDCRQPADLVEVEPLNAVQVRIDAHAGWSSFPLWWVEDGRCACRRGAKCPSPGKHPLFPPAHDKDDPQRHTCKGECGRLGHGLYDATRDPATLARWWGQYPQANIGRPAAGNNLAILDVDPRKGGDASLRELADYAHTKGVDIMATFTVHTGGDGLHLYYAAPDGTVTNGADVFGPDLPGLDVRGNGGYVVAPFSNHTSGHDYTYLDYFADVTPWPQLFTDLRNPPKPAAPPPTYIGTRPSGAGYATKALTNECEALAAMPPDSGRNNKLNTAAFNLGQLVGAGQLDRGDVERELLTAAHRSGLTTSEALATIASGINKGIHTPRIGRAA